MSTNKFLSFAQKLYGLANAINNPQTTGQKIFSGLWHTSSYGIKNYVIPHINPLTNKQYTPEEMHARASEFANVDLGQNQGPPSQYPIIEVPFIEKK